MGKNNKTNDINRIKPFKEWKVLTRQGILILWSDKKNLAVTILFPLIAMFITVWIAGKNMFEHYDGTKSGCFVIVSAAIWGGLFNSIQTIVKERDNIKRDYVTGLRIGSYTLSRGVIQFGLCMLQSFILTLTFPILKLIYNNNIPTKGIIFNNVMVEYYISIFLLMYAADAMGIMISCIVKKTETANVLAPYILIIQLIFSGILFEMKGAANTFSYLMLSRWGMEGLGSISNLNNIKLKIQMTVPTVPHKYQSMFSISNNHLLKVWGVLLGFSIIFLLIGNKLLHSVSKDTR